MAVRCTKVNISRLAKEGSFRCDCAYILANENRLVVDYTNCSDLFEVVGCKVDGSLIDDFFYVEIGDVNNDGDITPTFLSWSNRNDLNDNYFKKIEKGEIIKPQIGDILIPKVRPNLKKFILINSKLAEYYYTSAFLVLRPKSHHELLYYSLKTIFYNNLTALTRRGKLYPTITETDVRQLKVETQKVKALRSIPSVTLSAISNKQREIVQLKSTIVSDAKIINEVFNNYFNFDIDHFTRLKSLKKYKTSLSLISSDSDFRNSAKFYRPSGEFVMNELLQRTDKKVSDFISEPIIMGANISPSDFDEEGKVFYISMETVKNYRVELNETQRLSDHFVSQYKANSRMVQKGDILMTRSGVAIGKVAVVDQETDAVFSDFTMRIRLENINVQFVYYYFRSMYFQYLIEIHKKGLQNQNIFPVQIQKFPMLDLPTEEQEKIVAAIQAKIQDQHSKKERIAALQEEINAIIIQSSI